MQTRYEGPWDVPPMQTSYQGPFWTNYSGLTVTGPTSADWCGYFIEIWNGRVYTRWRAAWWRLEGPNPKFGYYDPARHQWVRERCPP